MQTQIAYVLISRDEDYYKEQTLFSVYSLLKYNPEAKISIVCDRETSETIKNKKIVASNRNIKIIAHLNKKMAPARFFARAIFWF